MIIAELEHGSTKCVTDLMTKPMKRFWNSERDNLLRRHYPKRDLGRDRSLTCSRQAVGLILTKIVGGRPVTNITFTCKRMLRTYKNRGDFWYYDKAPDVVKLMVNRIDMSALADLYKVTKDRRI